MAMDKAKVELYYTRKRKREKKVKRRYFQKKGFAPVLLAAEWQLRFIMEAAAGKRGRRKRGLWNRRDRTHLGEKSRWILGY
jgi:hypothetical protein